MKIGVLAVTEKGWKTAECICQALPGAFLHREKNGVRNALDTLWHTCDALVCVMAAGIVVRCISGLCQSKFNDPSIVVVDETGAFAVALLSGHIGGANHLAQKVAEACSGTAVISTASDLAGHTAIDLWAVENNLTIVNPERLAPVATKLLNLGYLVIYNAAQHRVEMPDDFAISEDVAEADIVISLEPEPHWPEKLHLLPRLHYLGMGCRRGVTVEEFEVVIRELEKNHGIHHLSIAALASIDLKKDEKGLRELAIRNKWPIRFFSNDALNKIETPSVSQIVKEKIGTGSVCEAAALLAAAGPVSSGRLVVRKIKWNRITAAVAVKVE